MYAFFFTFTSSNGSAKIIVINQDLTELQSNRNWPFYVLQPKCSFFCFFSLGMFQPFFNRTDNHFVGTGYLPVIGLSLTPSPLTLDRRSLSGLPSRPTGMTVWVHIVCCTGQHASHGRQVLALSKRADEAVIASVHLCIWLDFKAAVTVETGSGLTG